jgi:hypothetical protein
MGFVEANSQGMFNVKIGGNMLDNFMTYETLPVSKQDIIYEIEGGYAFGPIELFGNYSHDYNYEGVKYLYKSGSYSNYTFPTLTSIMSVKQNLTSWTLGVRYILEEVQGIKPFASFSIGESTLYDIRVSTLVDSQQNSDYKMNIYGKESFLTIKNSVGFRYYSSEKLFVQAQADYQICFGLYGIDRIDGLEMFSARIGIGTQF